MKALTLAATLIGVATAQLEFTPAEVAGVIDESFLDEISGMFSMRGDGNTGKLITCHDSDDDYMFVLNADGSYNSRVSLAGDDWRDAEEVTGYTKNGTNYIVLCEFGDNPASRDKKYLFRFEEPTVTGSDITIGAFDKIAYRLPASPLLEKGTNRGDFEGAFIDVIDNKMYFFSKRMPVNYIYSLPIQDVYSGTQTLTFEGTMHSDVAEETGGIISPANCVAAALSRDNNHALIKTYNMVFQFVRPPGRTWVDVMTNDAPSIETNYVGLGSSAEQEPQGESITFAHNDSGYCTISEYRSNDSVPLFFYSTVEEPVQLVFKYKYVSPNIHTFTITDNINWVIESSIDLVTWTELDEEFVVTSNGDGTSNYLMNREDKQREFYRLVSSSEPVTQ